MDDHQRRVWAQMLGQLDNYASGVISLERLVNNLGGLLGAADIHDQDTIDAFYTHQAPIDMELELRTEDWAAPGAASDTALATAISNYRTWAEDLLNDPNEQRL